MYDGLSRVGSTNYLTGLKLSPEKTIRTGVRGDSKPISTERIKANTFADGNYRFPERGQDDSPIARTIPLSIPENTTW